MPARFTAYLTDRPAKVTMLQEGACLRVGRGADCDFQIAHPSISRDHCQLVWQADGWLLKDPGSKNGSHLDGRRESSIRLGDRSWLRLGDVHCEFWRMSETNARSAEQRLSLRRATSRIMLEALGEQTVLPDLLQETVRAAVELAECERGFLLLPRGTGMAVAASHGLDRHAMLSRQFSGSATAIQRALLQRAPLVINDVRRDSELSGRESVLAEGLQTLLCLPLLSAGVLIGLLYVDSRKPGALITTLDLELLAAFAERASLWLTARRAIEAIDGAESAAVLDWSGVLEAQRMARP